MNNIRIVKDENGNVYLSQEDLLAIMNARLKRFPEELKELQKPKEGNIVGLDGKKNLVEPDQREIEHHRGMKKMLEGIVEIVGASSE